jgi:uncharacterized protein
MMSERFIKDPRELVKAGDVVKVKVLEVDLQRRRIALTMRLSDASSRARPEPDRSRPAQRPSGKAASQRNQEAQGNGIMADALRRALKH